MQTPEGDLKHSMDKMAGYGTDQQYEGSMAGTDIKDMMVQKAHELFSLCDKEEKGFITKRDMQRLQTELPLSPDQLEDVFDSLDDDKNGFLTLEEFTEGFGSFIGLGPPMEKQVSIDSSGAGSEKVYENDHLDSEDEEEHFNDLLGHLGSGEMFDNPELLRSMWGKLRRDDPDMLSNFESMLIKITSELKNTRQDYSSLESALRNKLTAHDEELRHLYEEMENQIKAEKEKVVQQEKLRERTMREELERELREKDRALQELINKHNDMEDRLDKLNLMEVETKQENEKLQQEKDSLQEELDQSVTELTESKSYITQLRNQQREEKRERAMAALHISEGIAIERESLVKQLELLRDMNKKLRDDKDEAEMKQAMLLGERAPHLHRDASCENNSSISKGPSLDNQGSIDAASSRKNHLVKQGSILSNYFDRWQTCNPDEIHILIKCGLNPEYWYVPVECKLIHIPPGDSKFVENTYHHQSLEQPQNINDSSQKNLFYAPFYWITVQHNLI